MHTCHGVGVNVRGFSSVTWVSGTEPQSWDLPSKPSYQSQWVNSNLLLFNVLRLILYSCLCACGCVCVSVHVYISAVAHGDQKDIRPPGAIVNRHLSPAQCGCWDLNLLLSTVPHQSGEKKFVRINFYICYFVFW